jgi:hypothetical protein
MSICTEPPQPVTVTHHNRIESVEPDQFLELAISRAPFERAAATARGLVGLVNSDSGLYVVVESEKLDRHRVT